MPDGAGVLPAGFCRPGRSAYARSSTISAAWAGRPARRIPPTGTVGLRELISAVTGFEPYPNPVPVAAYPLPPSYLKISTGRPDMAFTCPSTKATLVKLHFGRPWQKGAFWLQ